MKISLNWLNDFVDLSQYKPAEIAEKLTMTIAEVEGIHAAGEHLESIVVGNVLSVQKHDNADKLTVCSVDDGKAQHQVICGAPNVREGLLVAYARPGARVKWHRENDLVEIKKTTIRGVESAGMICAADEIGLADDATGEIMELDTTAKLGTPLKKALGLSDIVFDIDNKSLTHRADLFCHIGIARELAAAFGLKMNNALYESKFKSKKLKTVELAIANPESASRFVGTVLDVKIGPSPEMIRSRLEACGVRSINNVVDITNFVMLELGEPLHAYDYNKLKARASGKVKISVRHAKKREQITTLDGKSRTCNEDVQLIADEKGGVAVAGIMGGADTEVSESSTTIFLEAAQFDPIVTRKAAQYLGLRTEGSARWEKGISAELAAHATNRAIELFQKYADAKVIEGPEDLYAAKPSTKTITLRPEYVSELLGYELSEKVTTQSLKALGAGVQNLAQAKKVTPPWWRTDLNIEEDLVEEVGRVAGLEQIPEAPMIAELSGVEKDPLLEWGYDMLNVCVDSGMNEVKNYAFYGDRELQRAGLGANEHMNLLNALSNDLTVLRTTLLIGLIQDAVKNQRDYQHVWLCELGHTFHKSGEPRVLSGLVAGNKQNVFYDAKGVVEAIAQQLQVELSVVSLDEAPSSLHVDVELLDVGASGTIMFNGNVVGVIGLVREDIAAEFKSERVLAVFSIDVAEVTNIASRYGSYKPLSQYPAVKRDISFVLPSDVTFEQVQNTIAQAGGTELAEIDLFDIYEGGKLKAGMRSLAFHLAYRNPERTLTAEEAQAIHDRIMNALQKEHNAEVR